MRVIFLDIDGVLNSQEYAKRFFPREKSRLALDPQCVSCVNWLVNETGAIVVLSSTWRASWSIPAINDHLRKHGATFSVADKTPYSDDFVRGKEISMWIKTHERHGKPIKSFVILDDDSDMLDLMPYLIKADDKFGLTGLNATDAKRLVDRMWFDSISRKIAESIDFSPSPWTVATIEATPVISRTDDTVISVTFTIDLVTHTGDRYRYSPEFDYDFIRGVELSTVTCVVEDDGCISVFIDGEEGE
jgi:hypothetical protein